MRSHFKLYLSLSFLIIACIGGDLLDRSEHWLTPIQKNVCLLRLLSFSLFNSSFVSLVWRYIYIYIKCKNVSLVASLTSCLIFNIVIDNY